MSNFIFWNCFGAKLEKKAPDFQKTAQTPEHGHKMLMCPSITKTYTTTTVVNILASYCIPFLISVFRHNVTHEISVIFRTISHISSALLSN